MKSTIQTPFPSEVFPETFLSMSSRLFPLSFFHGRRVLVTDKAAPQTSHCTDHLLLHRLRRAEFSPFLESILSARIYAVHQRTISTLPFSSSG